MSPGSARTAAVVNPRSGSGNCARLWPEIAARLAPLTTRFTEYPGHAIAITRDLLEQGFDRILAVGGDGTINETANGFLRDDRPVRPGACLGIVPIGTGGDFRRTLGIPDIGAAVQVIQSGSPRLLDMGRVSFRARSGEKRTRYFVNVVSFGMGGEVAARSRNFLSSRSGKLAFLWATALVFFQYRPRPLTLSLDGGPAIPLEGVLNVAIGNGRYHGGGMHVCPRALPDDGYLDVTVIQPLGMIELVRALPVLYSDNIYAHPKAHHHRAVRVTALSEHPVSIEVDGEPVGTLPLEVALLPGLLPVLTPVVTPFP